MKNLFLRAIASLDQASLRESERFRRCPEQAIAPEIVLISGLGLYAELLIIRLHASFFQLFAYFKNISMLSCFLGLAIGYARTKTKRSFLFLAMPWLALQALLLYGLSHTLTARLFHNPVPENLTLGLGRVLTVHDFLRTCAFVLGVFSWNAVGFVPFGQAAVQLMQRRNSLDAYGLNLIGSLLGVLAFSALSFLRTPPLVWLAAAGVLMIILLRADRTALLWTVASVAALVLVFGRGSPPGELEVYSPYQKIVMHRADGGIPELVVANNYHQRILDLRPGSIGDSKQLQNWSKHYGFPYRLVAAPHEVLVVGSGTGNDVAAALRHGAGHVEAVEIDPSIIDLGRAYHAEKPYESPVVHLSVTDARGFIRHSHHRYDLIVYGLLDSHTLLSGHSGVRLDSYVYTIEAFREARTALTENGLLVLSFCNIHPALMKKLFLMLQSAFDGVSPRVYATAYDQGLTFVIGKTPAFVRNLPRDAGVPEVTPSVASSREDVSLSTDDWPFLYMPKRRLPVSVGMMLILVFLCSWFLLRAAMWGIKTESIPAAFFLGAGFMLLETTAITRLSLLFGNTWIVVTVVVCTVLTLAYLANAHVNKARCVSWRACYAWLIGLLALNYLLPAGCLSGLPLTGERVISTVLYLLPLYFASTAFSHLLKLGIPIGDALSSNILGAMGGGLLEYISMQFGFQVLVLVALGLYAAAGVLHRRNIVV